MQKVNNGGKESTVAQYVGAGLGQCIVSHRTGVVGRHLHDPEEIRKIRLADKGTQDRIDDVFYQRTDDVVEGGTDDHRDG